MVENNESNLTDVNDNFEQHNAETQKEKHLPQSQVTDLIRQQRKDAAEKARREVEKEYSEKLRALEEASKHQPTRQDQSYQNFDVDQISSIVSERLRKEWEEAQVHQMAAKVANKYLVAVDEAKNLYDDFDEVADGFNAINHGELLHVFSQLDENQAPVIYELLKNPSKLDTVDSLARRSPGLALKELKKLSKSISVNQRAMKNEQYMQTPQPLKKMRPTTLGGSGELSVESFKNQDWLRG